MTDYVHMCYPKNDQHLNIHSEDVEALVPILEKHKPKVVVEIGAGYGTSSKLFASFAEKLYSIDPVHRKEWDENLKEYGLQDKAEFIEGKSPWVNWDKPIDLLFIDGWHNYRNVIVDYFYFEKFVNPGGLIIFHDTRAFPAVKRAVTEILKTEDLSLIVSSPSRVGMEVYQKNIDKRGKSVFFGPWVGEFGWEVAWWQGWCRKKSREFDYVICSSFPGHEGFYEDFCDQYIPHKLTGQPMCGFANGLTGEFDYPNVTQVYAPLPKKFIPKEEQEFIQFGNKDTTYDILIGVSGHGRKQYEHWPELMEFLKDKKVACFGKTGDYPDGILQGTTDLRDIPVKQLMNYMSGAKVVLGPCSGAIHLASYCGANIVVWSDNTTYTFGQTLKDRFENILNPFGNKVSVIDQYNYNPPAEVVIGEIKKYL